MFFVGCFLVVCLENRIKVVVRDKLYLMWISKICNNEKKKMIFWLVLVWSFININGVMYLYLD